MSYVACVQIWKYIFKVNHVWVLLLALHHCWLVRCVRLQLLDHIFAPLQLLPFNQTNRRTSSCTNFLQDPLGWLKLPLQERISNRACSWDETKSVCSLLMHFIWSMATLHCFNSCNQCTTWYCQALKSRNSRNCIFKSWNFDGSLWSHELPLVAFRWRMQEASAWSFVKASEACCFASASDLNTSHSSMKRQVNQVFALLKGMCTRPLCLLHWSTVSRQF